MLEDGRGYNEQVGIHINGEYHLENMLAFFTDGERSINGSIQKRNLHQTTGGSRFQALITRTLCANILTAFSSFISEQNSGRGTTQGAALLKKSVRTVVAAKDNMTLMICPGSGTLAPASCDVIFGAMAALGKLSMEIDAQR